MTIIDGNGIDYVLQTSASSVDIRDLTIQGGFTDAGTLSGGAFLMNGAQIDANRLSLRRAHLLENRAKLGSAIRATSMIAGDR